eukprot:g9023.t1
MFPHGRALKFGAGNYQTFGITNYIKYNIVEPRMIKFNYARWYDLDDHSMRWEIKASLVPHTSWKAEEKVFGNSDLRQLICNYVFDPTTPWRNKFRVVVNELKQAFTHGLVIKVIYPDKNRYLSKRWEQTGPPSDWNPITSTFKVGITWERYERKRQDEEDITELGQVHWDHEVWSEQEHERALELEALELILETAELGVLHLSLKEIINMIDYSLLN